MQAPVSHSESDIVEALLRDFGNQEKHRAVWDTHWEETALRVLPYYSTSFYSKGNMTPGQKRTQDQYDTTAMGALWKFAAAMESMLTPANGRWQKMRPVVRSLKQDRESMLWMDQVTDILFHYRYSPHAGFQASMHDTYASIGAFGTGGMFVDEFKDPTQPGVKGLRYRHIPLGEMYIATNHQGQVDKVFRRFKMTLRQIKQRWADKMPDSLLSRSETQPDEEVFVVHAVMPNADFMLGRLDNKGKRFSSHYLLKDQRVLLEEGGYRCMPYSVARYITAPGEVYGRGPAMNVLPAIKVINEEKKIMLRAGHRAAAPPLLAHDDGIVDGINVLPDAVNYGGVSADGRPLVHAMPGGDIRIGKEMMDDERLAINDAFLVTLFQILVETPQMTATEVLERAREKGALLSPTMGRFQTEALGPMIEREFDLLVYQGLIPPPPLALLQAGGEYRVEYDAPLNRAMRSEEAAGIMRSVQWAGEIVSLTQDPSPMDNFDFDVIVPEIIDINGAPARYIKDPQVVASARQARAQEKQAQHVTQALPGMAAMTKAVAPQGSATNSGQPS